MAKETVKKLVYNLKRKIPKLQKFRCNICNQEYDNQSFAVDDERDCPLCDNRDCAEKL